MNAHRTNGRGSKYLVVKSEGREIMSDAVVFFPREDEKATRALVKVVELMDACEEKDALQRWLIELARMWRDIGGQTTWDE